MRLIKPLKWFSLASVILLANADSPPIEVALRSSWPAPPLLLEIIESATLESSDVFFPLVDALTNPEALPSPPPATPEAIYAFALSAVENLLREPGSLASMVANLALHTSTPKIEAFYGYYIDHDLETRRLAAAKEGDCGSWVDWYGSVVCDVDTLARLVRVETLDSSDQRNASLPARPKTLPFDHILPSQQYMHETPTHTAILYASLSSPNFRELHDYLLAQSSAAAPRVEYVLRHIPPDDRDESERNYLSGYGVFLDLKKMDYLALDDRHSHAGSSEIDTPDNQNEVSSDATDHILQLLQKYPVNITADDASVPLTEDELKEIGFQSGQLIRDSSNQIQTLKELSQNFPKYATALARRVTTDPALVEEVLANHLKAAPGINMVWHNGAMVDEKHMNPYTLLRLLRKERALILSLTSLGLSPGEAVDLLTHPAIGDAQSTKGVTDGLFDASDRLEEGKAIVYWNDIEKDKRYSSWNPSIHLLLRPMYPGQYPNVRLNLFNVIAVLDLSQTSSLTFITGTVSAIINRNFPWRMGVVPEVETEEGAKMARLFYYLIENYGRAKTMGYLRNILRPAHLQTPTVDWTLVRAEFDALIINDTRRKEDVSVDFDVIIGGGVDTDMNLDKARIYAERLGVAKASPKGHAFVNGKHFDMDDAFVRALQMELGQQLQFLQESMYSGDITEEGQENMSTFFYDLPTSNRRRNQHIYPSTSVGALKFSYLPKLFSRAGLLSPGAFVYPPRDSGSSESGETHRTAFTIYVVADLNSETGLALVKEALDSMQHHSVARISFVHNPVDDHRDHRPRMSLLLSHLLQGDRLSEISPKKLLQALGLNSAAVDVEMAQTFLSPEHSLRQITNGIALADMSLEIHKEYIRSCRLLTRELHLQSGEQYIIVNGRVVGPIGPSEFVAADFEALQTYEFRKRTGPIVEALFSIHPTINDYDQNQFTHLISTASAIISASQVPDPSETGLFDAPVRPRNKNYMFMDGNYTAFEFGNNITALHQLSFLVDPLSETAQTWAPLMEWLQTLPDVFIDLRINPSQYSELPLKRFYRYNIVPELNFDTDGLETPSRAVFNGLPIDPIYTLGMDVPPAWLVRPREAMYDLDNIQLGSLAPEDRTNGMQVVFNLDFLVVEGHARNPYSNAPPRGVQLQLTNGNGTSVDDTQIVATLGYLQFKTKPGVFQLEIREGRGRDIFQLESVGNEGWESLTVDEVGSEITLTSFEGLTLYPRLTRKLGMETEDVLLEVDDEREGSSNLVGDLISRVSSIFKPRKETSVALSGNSQADINIFTVASGLLYERFVSIMILSVLRNTNSSVKFWFIENFLSPSFLEFIPHLAQAYGFQYELVTYKWPSWLRAQKEKQRIIWAYKILFLDVLFPMDLKKVIFVDADQIVRADLQELVDLDLHGAPYGYTPMGDDNTDMEGFRFWKTGYWKDFLKGRPYHISALYVIDLIKFRQIAAGDILRQQYQGLSADPNSLANLDQDLPNNLQREVPIYSLPEDWLWCETWCSKDRLHRAKTIDLCQNPLTKEPKLARARAIPEWEVYDSEISRFARKLADEGLIRSNAAAVDVNVLANAGNKPFNEIQEGAVEVETQEQQPVIVDSDSQQRDEL